MKRRQLNQKKGKKAKGLLPITDMNTFYTDNEEEMNEII